MPAFPEIDLATWRARVERELGAKPFDKLIAHTLDGLAIEPLYATAPAVDAGTTREARGVGRSTARWRVTEAIHSGGVKAINDIALAAVADGADALWIGQRAASALASHRALDEALGGIDTREIDVFVDAGADGAELSRGDSVSGANVLADPVGALARQGGLAKAYSSVSSSLADLVLERPRPLLASTSPYHHAGASAVTELGLLTATLVVYADIGGAKVIEIDASPDLFVTIAKVRAVRVLAAKVAAALGRAFQRPLLVGTTSRRRLSTLDPHTNAVRATVESAGLAMGGVDLLITLPFDALGAGGGSESARKLGRHTQLALREESLLGEVLDAAGGAYYLESLTDELARKAWDVMREVERRGGLGTALESGWVGETIGKERDARRTAIGKRREVMVGVNDFARSDEVVEAPVGETDGAPSGGLHLDRDARGFEQLRERASALRASGAGPRATVVCLGDPTDARAREGFARRFLETGGFAVSSTTWSHDAAPEPSETDVVCLASSDARYAELGGAAVLGARLAYPRARVVIAGRKSALGEASTGVVDGEIYLGSNALETLSSLLDHAERTRSGDAPLVSNGADR